VGADARRLAGRGRGREHGEDDRKDENREQAAVAAERPPSIARTALGSVRV
jgi:hypothetical protein